MEQNYDVAIVGLGAMGSAAAYHLARRKQKVLGLDRFAPPHEWGSSHGQSRIIREAYFENPLYVPLVQRAYELWHALEQTAQHPLLRQTGGLMIGYPEGELVSGALRSARLHDLRHELLSTDQIRQRFPVFNPSDGMVGVWEPRAGVLYPEACIAAHLTLALQHGAQLQYDEAVTAWDADSDGVLVTTTGGQYRAGRLVLSAGAWIGRLVPDLASLWTIERQVLLWFEPRANAAWFSPDRCPIFIFEHGPGRHFYGFPDLGQGVKVAIFHEGETADPDALRREGDASDDVAMREHLSRYLPDANGRQLDTATCMFTNTSDFHFLIDFHPSHPQVLIASPCSGHGFKFASAIGEMLADLLTTNGTAFDMTLFRLERSGTEEP